MTVYCGVPDTSAGVALRMSAYLDCQARALGENGFQAIAGGPVGMSLLSGLVTIFVALIGYRLILGDTPGLRDGVSWTVRLGFVLALVTAWPAFQTLIYRVAIDGPNELAALILPASGLPTDDLDGRVQQAYDTIRLGSTNQLAQAAGAAAAPPGTAPASAAAPAAPASPFQFLPPMPQTASLFVLSTAGATGAFRIAVGFLLAVGPLAIMSLLFDATLGVFSGWIRSLAGMALATLAGLTVTAITLMVVESELAHLQTVRASGLPGIVDPQGLTTIVIVFALVMLITTVAATRMAGAFLLAAYRAQRSKPESSAEGESARHTTSVLNASRQEAVVLNSQTFPQSRAAAVAEALASSSRREQIQMLESQSSAGPLSSGHRRSPAVDQVATRGLGQAGGRRSAIRRTRTAARRDTIR